MTQTSTRLFAALAAAAFAAMLWTPTLALPPVHAPVAFVPTIA